MARLKLHTVVEGRRANAALGWLLVAFLGALVALDVLDGNLLWAGFTAVVAVLALIPAVVYRNAEAMLPWEVLFLASLPLLTRALVTGRSVGGVTLTGRVSTYLAVAAVALIVAVELDVFTSVRMSHSFAVFFVAIATVAAAGVWAVVQWLFDLFAGTRFLLDGRPEAVVEAALMWDFVAATLAGVLAGVVFEFYFRQRSRAAERVPTDVDAEATPGGDRR